MISRAHFTHEPRLLFLCLSLRSESESMTVFSAAGFLNDRSGGRTAHCPNGSDVKRAFVFIFVREPWFCPWEKKTRAARAC